MYPLVIHDMTGREIVLDYLPQRIVSLVPSQTELLYDLGLDDRVVGISKFCVHPEEWFRNKKRVGGTKTVHLDIIDELMPDLIIANKEENTKEQIEALSAKYPVWVSDIHTFDYAMDMITRIGALTGKEQEAINIVNEIEQVFETLSKTITPKSAAYFIWYNPWMCAGGDTFISDILCKAGFENVFSDRMRYPEITLEELKEVAPEIVLLSSEPYPFKERHIKEIKAVLPDANVILTDGEMWSWYGSRLRHAVPYICSFINELMT